ncbi:MAG: Do family serine endopeptidase [Gammaproteobacteria bacterium]|nr:Do family serine endopeptidase [Gammaproteobacteria bacterium]MDH5629646.1 Do family serine endopeptidase [Gammaproteobacteria bacterium]
MGKAIAALPADVEGKPLPSLSKMLKSVNPAVVNIATFSEQQQRTNPLLNDPFFRRFFNIPEHEEQNRRPQKRQMSAGSGVIVDAKKGIVITNNHVIKRADEVRVSLVDGRHFTAKVLGTDPDLDIAVLKIDADNLTAVKLGDSKQMEVGDFVVAIGNPFGLGQTVTTGIVSALDRTGLGIEGYENFIQTDASINPGNSGGALVNLRGELIGINTAIIAPAGGNVGIGFAIPFDMAKSSMDQIIEHGEVKRGQIGVGIQDITVDLQIALDLDNGQQGVVVTNVVEDSPAQKAGIKADDIIIAINGEETKSTGQLRSQIAKHQIGDKLQVKLLRNGKVRQLNVAIGESEAMIAADGSLHKLLQDVKFEDVDDGQGVAISEIAPDSYAAYRGLRPGDIIVAANKIRVKNVKDFAKALAKDSDKILLRVKRGRNAFYLVLR